MVNQQKSVLPEVEEPQPIYHVVVRRVLKGHRVIKFDGTPDAIREIERKGYGFVNQKHGSSGWCVLVVNRCYPFEDVVAWMRSLVRPIEEDLEDAA